MYSYFAFRITWYNAKIHPLSFIAFAHLQCSLSLQSMYFFFFSAISEITFSLFVSLAHTLCLATCSLCYRIRYAYMFSISRHRSWSWLWMLGMQNIFPIDGRFQLLWLTCSLRAVSSSLHSNICCFICSMYYIDVPTISTHSSTFTFRQHEIHFTCCSIFCSSSCCCCSFTFWHFSGTLLWNYSLIYCSCCFTHSHNSMVASRSTQPHTSFQLTFDLFECNFSCAAKTRAMQTTSNACCNEWRSKGLFRQHNCWSANAFIAAIHFRNAILKKCHRISRQSAFSCAVIQEECKTPK